MSKILLFDIETAGPASNTADLAIVVCIGYKWLDEKKVHCLTIDEKSLRKFDDKKILKEFAKIFEKAELIVGHYASVFDRRFLQGRLLINNLPPLPHTRMRDTCFMARKIGNFSRNRLGYLCDILKLENRKQPNNWPDAWFAVLRGDMKALAGMARYCKGDVMALESLYKRLAAFDHNHPHLITNRSACGLCGSKRVQYRGKTLYNDRWYRRFVCLECKKWGREKNCIKEASK